MVREASGLFTEVRTILTSRPDAPISRFGRQVKLFESRCLSRSAIMKRKAAVAS